MLLSRLVSDLLIDNQFMAAADYQMKKAAYITLLKCSKLLFTSVANARLYRFTLQIKKQEKTTPNDEYNAALQLQVNFPSLFSVFMMGMPNFGTSRYLISGIPSRKLGILTRPSRKLGTFSVPSRRLGILTRPSRKLGTFSVPSRRLGT